MVQNYTPYSQNPTEQFQTLKPNIKKLVLRNLLSIIGAVLLIIILFTMIHFTVELKTFMYVFEVFNVDIKPMAILLYSFLLIIAITIFLLSGNYLVSRNLRYEFYQNKLIAYEGAFFIFVRSKEIPYQNIVKVSYNNDGVFNTIFNSGTIVIELTGMKESKIELEFIDNTEQIVQYIQNLIRQSMLTQQARFTEGYRMGNVVDGSL